MPASGQFFVEVVKHEIAFVGRGLGNVANAMPRAATKGIASTFETFRKVGGRDGTHINLEEAVFVRVHAF